MKNRAKCKKCGIVLESLDENTWVYCQCGEIGISGGTNAFRCYASDFINFLRVDDEGNEIIVTVQTPETPKEISSEELIKELDHMIETIEKLPDNAKLTAINHYDFCSLLYLLSFMFKLKCR